MLVNQFSVKYGQRDKPEIISGMIDTLPFLAQIDAKKKNPYFVISHKDGNYIQAMRSPQGYIVECRYFFHQEQERKNWDDFIHYRAWNHNGHQEQGKADPRSGEWGPWIHERDHLTLELAAALLDHYIILQNRPELPVAAWVHWRDVTEEFPEIEHFKLC